MVPKLETAQKHLLQIVLVRVDNVETAKHSSKPIDILSFIYASTILCPSYNALCNLVVLEETRKQRDKAETRQ